MKYKNVHHVRTIWPQRNNTVLFFKDEQIDIIIVTNLVRLDRVTLKLLEFSLSLVCLKHYLFIMMMIPSYILSSNLFIIEVTPYELWHA